MDAAKYLFPWKDKMFGTLSEEYIAARQEIVIPMPKASR